MNQDEVKEAQLQREARIAFAKEIAAELLKIRGEPTSVVLLRQQIADWILAQAYSRGKK